VRRKRDPEDNDDRDASPDMRMSTNSDDNTGLIDRVSGIASDAKEKLSDALETTTARVQDLTHSVKDTTQNASARVQETALSARVTVANMLDEQPLVIGALGIAMGAALGAMLPSTAAEDRLFGQASNRVASKAKQVASEQYGRVKETIQDVAEQVTSA
jgi:hypothetical protein